MRVFARFFRLIWGNDVDRALRPVLAVTFVGSAAFSAGWVFVGIWAVDELGATSREVGFAFLVARGRRACSPGTSAATCPTTSGAGR